MSRTCISVIVPCFNSGKYLSSCLDSLLNQDFDESYNIILIDCKSEGKEKEIGTRYQAQHPGKIYYYRYEKNDGPSLSRNLGLRHANGAFITMFRKIIFPLCSGTSGKKTRILRPADTISITGRRRSKAIPALVSPAEERKH